jgi:hypothetical protein
MHHFIRGIAIFGFAPSRDGTIDPQRREDDGLEGGALVLARAIGDPKGQL